MSELVSVIIPIYNCEKYLKKCLMSLVGQSYSPIEVILVDDGSSDNSGKICDAFCKRSDIFTVIHQKNGGVSAARNAGLKRAKGTYCCFVDGDDWLPNDAIEKMRYALQNNKADLCTGNLVYCDPLRNKSLHPLESKEWVYEKNDLNQYLEYHAKWDIGACGRLFRMDIIKREQIEFPATMKLGEDKLFVNRYVAFCTKLVCLSNCVYYYNRLNVLSATHKIYCEYPEWKLAMAESLEDSMQGIPQGEDTVNAVQGIYLSFWFAACAYTYDMVDDSPEEKNRRMFEITRLFSPPIHMTTPDSVPYMVEFRECNAGMEPKSLVKKIAEEVKPNKQPSKVKRLVRWVVCQLRFLEVYIFDVGYPN